MSGNYSPGGETPLAVTGFGPGTILVAIIGGVLSFGGWIMRKISRRPKEA